MARRQLLALGYSKSAIGRRAAAGRLHRVHRGVYAVGYARLGAHGRCLAAVFACGPQALLSHGSAAWLWDLIPARPQEPEIVVPYRPHAKGSIRIRHAPNLRSADRTVREAIPVTSVSRTLLDLAAVLTRPRLDRVLEQAERLRRLDRRRLEEALTRSPTRHGTRRLRAALDLYIEPEPTRSELERSFLDLVRAAGLRSPSVNAAIGGYEVDFLWRDERMAVEVDGFEFHGTRAAFERDRARDHDLQMEGIQVVRLTWRRLRDDGAEVAERLGEALRRNRIERGERKR